MRSKNFEILRDRWPELAAIGGFAEAYVHPDPVSALVKLRLFAENLTKDIYRDLRLPKPDQPTFVDLLNNPAFAAITPKVVLDKLHALRMHGNKAAHGEQVKQQNALWLLREAYDLARWLFVRYGGGNAQELPVFQQPSAPQATEGRERRQLLERIAAQEAQMDSLLRELETIRLQATAAEKKPEELQALAGKAAEAARELEFDEATTRARLIDSLLASSGWNVAPEANTEEVGKEIEVRYQPTSSGIGYADYVLWDDNGKPLAVIEAKKTSVDAERGRQQAKLYADGLESEHGKRPVIFYTNGFDIWIWDDAQGFPPRKLYGFYSKDSLQHLVNYQRAERRPLDTLQINEAIVDRMYQIEAIKRVAERFTNRHRRALIVQATGTGKTRVAIALADLLIRAGWVKRVLFLCDRRELRKQAKNAFNDFLTEPIRVITSRVKSNTSERIFLATYPAMQKVFQSFDPGFFDLIGYSKSREMALSNTSPDSLPVFDRVPRSKLALPVLVFKFLGKTSIFLYTESLGKREWHGRTAILVDEHTAGAAEMVAQFAQENHLATIVGMKTAGRLVTRRASKLGFGYRLVIPIAAYVSAKGTQIEGNGITPDVSIPWSSEDASAGLDRQLNGAIESLRAA